MDCEIEIVGKIYGNLPKNFKNAHKYQKTEIDVIGYNADLIGRPQLAEWIEALATFKATGVGVAKQKDSNVLKKVEFLKSLKDNELNMMNATNRNFQFTEQLLREGVPTDPQDGIERFYKADKMRIKFVLEEEEKNEQRLQLQKQRISNSLDLIEGRHLEDRDSNHMFQEESYPKSFFPNTKNYDHELMKEEFVESIKNTEGEAVRGHYCYFPYKDDNNWNEAGMLLNNEKFTRNCLGNNWYVEAKLHEQIYT